MTTIVVGEALVDIFETEDGPVELPGGSAFNVARGLGLLGRPVHFATDIGTGSRADLLAATLEKSGAELWPGSTSNSPTSTARAWVAPDGSASYEFNLHFNPPMPPAPGTEGAATLVKLAPHTLHTGSLAVHLAPDTIRAWIDALSHVATITYDPNFRTGLGPHDEILARTEEFIALSDVVKASRDDIELMYPGMSENAVITKWLSMGPQIVAVTGAEDGAVLATEDLRVRSKTPKVEVVDRVGAGDAFMSALIDALGRTSMLGEGTAESRRMLSERQLRSIAGYANAGGAVAVSRRGAVPPTKDELLSFVSSFSVIEV
ncbi:PfkB family carbohydrate kinase [Flaviflexus huanghaiensis]|uniref:PfkB family carbohydrate kinase n=1 Tax=Flaviflexus huanghaiensis TaxID=1111473 RepID=UPI0015F7A26E